MLENQKREAVIQLTSDEEVEAWLRHQEEIDAAIKAPQRGLGIRGTMHAILRKADGRLIVVRKHNGIVNNGFSFIANSIGNRAAAGATAAMGWIAIGSNALVFSASQAALSGEVFRQAATFSHTTGTKIFSFTTTFAAGVATGSIGEAGVFNQATLGGTMLDRVAFSPVSKTASDTLTQTFTFTMT